MLPILVQKGKEITPQQCSIDSVLQKTSTRLFFDCPFHFDCGIKGIRNLLAVNVHHYPPSAFALGHAVSSSTKIKDLAIVISK